MAARGQRLFLCSLLILLQNLGGAWASGLTAEPTEAIPPIRINDPIDVENLLRPETDWQTIQYDSLLMLTFQHGWRLGQEKTRAHLGGPFFGDYLRSVKGLGGWADGDNSFTNYFLHPLQGATSGFVYLQNNDRAESTEFGFTKSYWSSRLRALAFATAYSVQFELGPYSEASVGNVGKTPGTMAWVDLVVTPLGGFTWILAEDAIDRFVLRPIEEKHPGPFKVRLLRVLLNPSRSLANLLRLRAPWYRKGRDADSRASQEPAEQQQASSEGVEVLVPTREMAGVPGSR
jgi:hypothetical protein